MTRELEPRQLHGAELVQVPEAEDKAILYSLEGSMSAENLGTREIGGYEAPLSGYLWFYQSGRVIGFVNDDVGQALIDGSLNTEGVSILTKRYKNINHVTPRITWKVEYDQESGFYHGTYDVNEHGAEMNRSLAFSIAVVPDPIDAINGINDKEQKGYYKNPQEFQGSNSGE